MSARASAEAEVWGDWRFHALARELGCEWHAAIGKMLHLWGECTRRTADLEADDPPVYALAPEVVGAIIGYPPDVATRALVTSCLAEETPEGLRMKGTRNRVEWLRSQRLNGRKGGLARASAAARDGGKFVGDDTVNQAETRHSSGGNQAQLRRKPGTAQAETRPTVTVTTTATATTRSSAAGAARGFAPLIAEYQEGCRDGEELQGVAAKLGAHMRARREALRLSQRDVAAKVPDPSLDARGLGNAERGKRDVGLGTWTAWHEALVKLEGVSEPGRNPDHARFIAEFSQLWRAHHGASGPTWQGANGGRLHKDLQAALAQHGLDELLRRARNMFASPLGFPLTTESDKDAATLLRHLDRFVTVRGQLRPVQQPQPHGEQRALRTMDECKW